MVVKSPGRLAKRSAWRLLQLLLKGAERIGANVRTLADINGRPAGAQVQWLPDEEGLVRGGIKTFDHDGMLLRWFFIDEMEEIQRRHRRGLFYEPEELKAIAGSYRGGTFVDVGANVGNHSVFAARILKAAVIAFEPQPLAAEVLAINAALNHCSDAVAIRRRGLSHRTGGGRAVQRFAGALGATRIDPDPAGTLPLVTGDAELEGVDVGFLKIDTEGAEMAVLAGLEDTIARCRPPLFVEVENENLMAFQAFCTKGGYRVEAEFRRYDSCTNFLAIPTR